MSLFLIPCLAAAATLFAAPVEFVPADLRGAGQPQAASIASGPATGVIAWEATVDGHQTLLFDRLP